MSFVLKGAFPEKKEESLLQKVTKHFQEPLLPLRYQNWWEFSQMYRCISKLERTPVKMQEQQTCAMQDPTYIIDFFDAQGKLTQLITTKGERWDDLTLFHAYLGEYDYEIGSRFWSTVGKIPRESPAIFLYEEKKVHQYTRKELTAMVRESFHALEDAMAQRRVQLLTTKGPSPLYNVVSAQMDPKKKLVLIPGYG